jgi:hypothetical protein
MTANETRPPEGPEAGAGSDAPPALRLGRGVARALVDWGYVPLREFSLNNGRRTDVIGMDGAGRFVIVEIKSSEADFRADDKWTEYEAHCDLFYFAVAEDFPLSILPADRGLLVADAFGAEIVREASDTGMNPARRRAQILRFAIAAGQRLHQFVDPRP